MCPSTRNRGTSAGLSISALILAPALTACLTGCALFDDGPQVDNSNGAPRAIADEPNPLVARASSQVADLPVPLGFRYQEGKSRAQVSGALRYVSVYYKGYKSKERVASFYRRQMPANHRWKLESFRTDRGTFKLDFAKGGERCNIVITEDFWGNSLVHAEIYHVEPMANVRY
jgi:hypothetical protein